MHQARYRNRLYWLLGVITTVVVLLVWFIYGLVRLNEPESQSSFKVTTPHSSQDNLVQLNGLNTSTSYIEGVEERNRLDAINADRSGESHVDRLVDGVEIALSNTSTDLSRIEDQLAQLSDTQGQISDRLERLARRSKSSSDVEAVAFYRNQDGVDHLSDAFRVEEYESFSRALDAVYLSSARANSGIVLASSSQSTRDTAQGSATRSGRRQSQTAQVTKQYASSKQVIIKAHTELLHAKLNLGINSDIGGVASATIIGGQHHGTTLIASDFDVRQRHIAITFESFCLSDGRCGDIQAVAVDLDQGVAGLKGEYKGNYGIRLGGAIAASIVEGYGRASSSGIGAGSIIIDGRLISTENQPVSSQQALKASALEAGSTLGQFFREMAQRPPRIEKQISETIGIYVVTPGTLSLDMDSGDEQWEAK